MPTHKKCTRMFVALLFVITKRSKPLNCPSTGEWINKIWYSHTMEYYLAIKMEILIYATTCMNFKNIMLSGRSQAQRTMCYMILVICNIHIRQIYKHIKQQWWLNAGQGIRSWKVMTTGYRVSFHETILKFTEMMAAEKSGKMVAKQVGADCTCLSTHLGHSAVLLKNKVNSQQNLN